MWMQQGKTVQRVMLDQQAIVPTWGAFQQQIAFAKLRTIGLLKSLALFSPTLTGTSVVGGGTFASWAAGTEGQLWQLRQIQQFQLQSQGLATLYNVTGLELGFLAYTRNGNTFVRRDALALGGFVALSGAFFAQNNAVLYNEPSVPIGITSAPFGQVRDIGPYFQVASGAASFNTSYIMEIPLTEFLVFPNTPIGQTDKMVLLKDQLLEVGYIIMQNSTQSVNPVVTLAPLTGTTAQGVIVITGNATATASNQQWNIEDTFIDYPASDADAPPPFATQYVVTRIGQDYPVSGGKLTVQHQPAGLLLKTIWSFYNDNDATFGQGTLIDAARTPAAVITLQSGSSIVKIQETAQNNIWRSWRRYGIPPPGILVHDLVDEQGYITNAIDTAALSTIQTLFTGLSGSITRARCCEVRLIGVV